MESPTFTQMLTRSAILTTWLCIMKAGAVHVLIAAVQAVRATITDQL